MKIAVAGKGGSGKTTVAGTLARAFAATGYDVLAIDVDDDPNLGVSLGVPPDEVTPLPDHFVQQVETPEGEIPFELSTSAQELVDEHGSPAPGGVMLLTAGSVEAGSGGFTMYHVTVRIVLSSLTEDHDEVTIVDLPNGYEHFGLGTATDVDVLLAIAEPSSPSLETVRKTTELAAELDIPAVRVIANKVRTDRDRATVEAYCTDHDLEIAAVIPDDIVIRQAERDGTAPMDVDADSPGVSVMSELAATHDQRRNSPISERR